jgi:hypothetical protein
MSAAHDTDRGRVIWALVLAAVGALSVHLAGREDGCVVSGFIGDAGTTRGSLRMTATTTQVGCMNTKTLVWGGIVGHQFQCLSGEEWQTSCYGTSEGANAHVSLSASAYGLWQGRSAHAYSRPDAYETLPNKYVTLDGGHSDEEECEASGGYWYNDGCYSAPAEEQACIDNGGHWNGQSCDLQDLSPDPESPIIIATGSGSYHLTSARAGVQFDINGDGMPEQVAWTQPNDEIAFLAIDLDGDGTVSSGRELFGNHTVPGVSNGFRALGQMAMSSNGGVQRGSVSSEDPVYERLLLWTDRNHNGISEPSELRPASELLADIGLGYETVGRRDKYGNLFRYQGWVHYRTAPGRNRASIGLEDVLRRRQVYDVYLALAR